MDEDLSGIGGWLLLPALGMLITPPLNLYRAYADIMSAPRGAWWIPVYRYELLSHLAMFLGGIVLAVIFFKLKQLLPWLMIIALIANLVMAVVDLALRADNYEYRSLSGVWASLVGCLIWIPYFLRSRRVKATFVK